MDTKRRWRATTNSGTVYEFDEDGFLRIKPVSHVGYGFRTFILKAAPGDTPNLMWPQEYHEDEDTPWRDLGYTPPKAGDRLYAYGPPSTGEFRLSTTIKEVETFK